LSTVKVDKSTIGGHAADGGADRVTDLHDFAPAFAPFSVQAPYPSRRHRRLDM
jgi:hypothetical protein